MGGAGGAGGKMRRKCHSPGAKPCPASPTAAHILPERNVVQGKVILFNPITETGTEIHSVTSECL